MIKDILAKKRTLSFEVFPPKKDDDFAAVYSVLDALSALSPDFISVTYGAGGSRAGRTAEIASYISNTLHIEPLAHLTCVGNDEQTVLAQAAKLEEAHVPQILALRGDKPRDMDEQTFLDRHFRYANNLIDFIRANTNLRCSGACYPEGHPEARTLDEDIECLKIKQDSGADFFTTQMFFDNDFFWHFLDKARAAGITVPIIAGIMPITSASQLGSSVSLSGSSLPKAFTDMVALYSNNPDDMRKAGIDYAITQIRQLQHDGTDGIHIYTMNKTRMAAEIVSALD